MTHSPRLKKVLEDAESHAHRRGREFVGTEDVLLALMYETGGIAHEVLMSLDVNGPKIEREIDKLCPPPPPVTCPNCCGTGKVKAF